MGTVINYPEFHARRRLKCEAHGKQFLPYGVEQAEFDDLVVHCYPIATPVQQDSADDHEIFMASMREPHVSTGYRSIFDGIRNLFRSSVPDNKRD